MKKSVKMELFRNQKRKTEYALQTFYRKLLGLQDIGIEKIEEIDNSIQIFRHLKRKLHKCFCCSDLTNTIHDYREQVIKNIPAFGKNFFIHLKKRRYCCSCGKRFAETNFSSSLSSHG